MQRGAMTRGRYARLMAGAEAIEIKATIPPQQVAAALAHYRLSRNNDEQRFIYTHRALDYYASRLRAKRSIRKRS